MRMRINNGYKVCVCVCSKLWGLVFFFKEINTFNQRDNVTLIKSYRKYIYNVSKVLYFT